MPRHACEPREDALAFEVGTWTCPECGDIWIAEPFLPPDPAPYVEMGQSGVWTRMGQPDD